MGQIEKKLQDDKFKSNHIDNYIMHKQSMHSSYKTEIVRLDLKSKLGVTSER